ncbi:hypothetical protein [Rhizobium sp.]|uniref:hypothetical protein n=1 Tax=Rhizobium sp. TaxID=391 RepID=UPI002EE54694
MMAAMSVGIAGRSRQGECSQGTVAEVLFIALAVQVNFGIFKENNFDSGFETYVFEKARV